MIGTILAVALLAPYFFRREPSALEVEAALRLADLQEKKKLAEMDAIRAEARLKELKIQETIRLRHERWEKEADQAACQKRYERNLRAAQREARRQKWAAQGYVFQP